MMVRVVACHHFLSQDVFLSQNEPVAFCAAQGKLLVATTQRAVNVHDLESRGNVLHSFPTVDLVKQIIFCESGNYIATVESKASWHRSLITYVRIYFKWWIDVSGQALKVRIAGTAPPSTNSQSWSKMFEMVELPLDKTALCISCCNKTSSLSISLGNIISIYCCSSKVEPTTKQYFNDFDHFADIVLPIITKDLKVCENFYACMSDKAVLVFKIVSDKDNENNDCKTIISELEDVSDDLTLYDENFVEWRFESCTSSGGVDKNWENHLRTKLDASSFPINIHLNLIDKENEIFSSNEEYEIIGPVLTVRGCSVDIRLDSKMFEMFPDITSNINAVTLLFKQIIPKTTNSLMGLHLIPMYITKKSYSEYDDPLNAAASALECSFSFPWPNIDPNSQSFLKAIGCFFSTLQEGYLYDVFHKPRFVNNYVYTSTLKGVGIETTLLHALTETGLETYTVHLPHSALHYIEDIDNIKNIVPSYEESVCLLGLRPFLGVDYLVMSENHVVLASSVEDSVANNEGENGNNSTLYSLKKAPPAQIFIDLLEAGESHKNTSSAMYYNLLSSAHVILRTQLLCNDLKDIEVEALYRKSCLLLGDYFICSDSEKLNAIPYYNLSQLSPENIIQRIIDLSHQNKHLNVLKPLVHLLNNLLINNETEYQFSPPQAVAEVVISAYSEEAPELLWKVVLCSQLTGYKIDKVILTFKRRLTSKRHPLSPISNAADTLALVYLLMQKDNCEAAQNMLLSLSKADLVSVLRIIYHKIWSNKNLSSLGKFIKQVRPDALIELFLSGVESNYMAVSDLIQILQKEESSFDLHCVPLLKEFLETLLSDKKMLNDVDSSVPILLVKIYLKRLLEPSSKNGSNSTYSNSMGSLSVMFGSRPTWLNEMPPFNGKGIFRACTAFSKDSSNSDNSESSVCGCWTCHEDLLRLQSLLSYLGPNEEVKSIVLDFLYSTEDKKINWLSLEVMCSNEAQAIKLLIGLAPRALLPYAIDTLNNEDAKWCTLFKLLHEHVINLPENNLLYEVYSEAFQGVLSYLAEILKPATLINLLPDHENPVFLPHIKRCIEKHQAHQLKTKIMALGQEIKSMM